MKSIIDSLILTLDLSTVRKSSEWVWKNDLNYIQIHLFHLSLAVSKVYEHTTAYGPKDRLFELKICSRFETCFEQYISMKI